VNEVLTLKLNAIQVLGVASLGVAAGIWLKDRIRFIDRLNIPASIVGGLILAVLALLLRDRYMNLEMDVVLRDILMVAFFTTIGLGASLRLVRVGGVQVIWFWLLASLGTVFQNLLGLGLARVFGLDPLLGIISGSVTMAGGPATALAFGQTFERMGVEGATTVALAAATFGIVAGGMLGGATGAQIIRRLRLAPAAGGRNHLIDATKNIAYADHAVNPEAPALASGDSLTEHSPLMNNVLAIAVAMGLGTLVSLGFEGLGLVLPSYVGAMIAAAALRNLDDRLHFAAYLTIAGG
jgi:glutamate:Na+ symporter, ESS family